MSNNIDGEDRALRTKVFKDSKELEEIEAKKKLNTALSEKKIKKNNEEINNIFEIHEINNSIKQENAVKISFFKLFKKYLSKKFRGLYK